MFLFTLPRVKQDFYHLPDKRSHFHRQPETHVSLFPVDLGSVRALQPTSSSSFPKANLCSFIQGEYRGVGCVQVVTALCQPGGQLLLSQHPHH